MDFRLISSSYVPYTIPLSKRLIGGSVEYVAVTLLRGTSIGLYVDHMPWESNVPLPSRIVEAQRSVLGRRGVSAGVVTYVDAPEGWVGWVGHTIVCGTVLALRTHLGLGWDIDSVAREVTEVYDVDGWLVRTILSRGLSYMRFLGGRLVEHSYVKLGGGVRIVVGFRAPGCVDEFNVPNGDPREVFSVVRESLASGSEFSIIGDCGILVLTTRPNLGRNVKRVVRHLGGVDDVVVAQPDNVGVRVYKPRTP